jgi:hypothetical protein
VTQETIRRQLKDLVADPEVKVTTLETRGPSSPPHIKSLLEAREFLFRLVKAYSGP